MPELDAEVAAGALADWFRHVGDVLDRTVFAAGSDEAHRRAAALIVVTRHAALLEAAAGEPVIEVRETVWVLAGATRALGVVLGRPEWLAAVRNAVSLDAQLRRMPEASAWIEGDAASIFREHLVETLRQAGVARVPTILDAANRRTALGLSVNWGMRFLVAAAAQLVDHEVTDRATREVVGAVAAGTRPA